MMLNHYLSKINKVRDERGRPFYSLLVGISKQKYAWWKSELYAVVSSICRIQERVFWYFRGTGFACGTKKAASHFLLSSSSIQNWDLLHPYAPWSLWDLFQFGNHNNRIHKKDISSKYILSSSS